MSQSPTIRPTPLFRHLDGKVQCEVCERRCIIDVGEKGFCRTKINIDGKLHTIVFGDISALESRPIEIKPFFHYYPGSWALTFSTWSCNFRCPWCQNYELSTTLPNIHKANYISPAKMIELAVCWGNDGLCVSFQEPLLLFEYSLEVFKIAEQKGLYNCYVSNGYMTISALELLKSAGLTGLKIDVKGDKETYKKHCGNANVEHVWRNANLAKRLGIHVEIVNLIITHVNDNEHCIKELIMRHLKEVGEDTPLHFTRYYPAHKFHAPQTKIETLEYAYKTAKKLGVLYPYLGNVPGHKYENTYCPQCNELIIKRYGHTLIKLLLKNGKCIYCNNEIKIRV